MWGVPRDQKNPAAQGGGSTEQGLSLPLPFWGRNGAIWLCCAPDGVVGGDAAPVADWFYWVAGGRFHRVLAAGWVAAPAPPVTCSP